MTNLFNTRLLPTALFSILVALAVPASAQKSPMAFEDLDSLALEDLLQIQVVGVTKHAQVTRQAPANVTVITRDDLRRAGYTSIAEALTYVTGLVVNTDHVFSNVGLRGISGGIRGGSRHVKILIDGQPVAFRPDAQNFLGPELIPIAAVERIEIIRGPSSALYGLNAFLGVVSIITREASSLPHHGALLVEAGRIQEGLSGSAQAVGGGTSEKASFLLAAGAGYEDRSNLRLPSSSPTYAAYAGNLASEDDLSRPLSAFGSTTYTTGAYGTFNLRARFSELNARGEYADTGALSHATTIDLRHFSSRIEHSFDSGWLKTKAFASYEHGGPGPKDVVLPMLGGQPIGQLVERDFNFRAVTVGVEPTATWSQTTITLGAEADWEYEDLRRNIFISRETGQRTESRDFGSLSIANYAGYAQALCRELDPLGVSANLRYDHNSLFGNNWNYRAGVTWSMTEQLYLKLLSGSSYRAPSPEQLYGTPVAPGGVEGALASSSATTLAPQTALTHELVLGYEVSRLTALLSAYGTTVTDRIEYVSQDGNLQPANLLSSDTLGVELSIQGHWLGGADSVNIRASAGAAYETTSFSFPESLTPRERTLLGVNELFPPWSGNATLDIEVPRYYLGLNARLVGYSRRLQSQTNQSVGRIFVDDELLYIGASYPLDLTLSTRGWSPISERETRVGLRARDILRTASAEPGFNGINIPAYGRRFFVTVEQDI